MGMSKVVMCMKSERFPDMTLWIAQWKTPGSCPDEARSETFRVEDDSLSDPHAGRRKTQVHPEL
jgi:hypothetical protein